MNKDIKVIGVEPAETSVISGDNPGYIPSILDVQLIDEVVKVCNSNFRTLIMSSDDLVDNFYSQLSHYNC